MPTFFERGSGNVISESRPLGDFNQVLLAGIGSLSITQAETESLIIEAEDNLLPKLISEVHGDTLYLSIERSTHLQPTRPIRYVLTVRSLSALELAGSGTIQAQNLQADHLTVTLSGSGRVTLESCNLEAVRLSGSGTIHAQSIDVPDLVVTLSGSGEVLVKGQVHEQTVRIPGSGVYNASGLESQEASIDVSGAGRAIVNVSETLTARISGAGLIEYMGKATLIRKISGFGAIRYREDPVIAG